MTALDLDPCELRLDQDAAVPPVAWRLRMQRTCKGSGVSRPTLASVKRYWGYLLH